jgi:hypothetical protein
MRYKLSVFVALGAIILGLEYLFLEQPWESFILSTFWQRFFIAAILAGGATWLWFQLRSARQTG